MTNVRRLRLVPNGAGKSIEGEFGPGGLLFLVSSPGGLALVPEPSSGQLAYAMFLQRRGKIHGAALHAAASLGKGKIDEPVRPGDPVTVGLARFEVAGGSYSAGSRLRCRQRAVILVFVSLIVLASCIALLFVLRQAQDKRERGAQDERNLSMSAVRAEPVEARTALRKSAVTLIDEAREYLRMGQTAQAKLCLMEAIEADTNNVEARKLLDEIEKGESASVPKQESAASGGGAQPAGREDEAQSLFRDGIALKEEGDLAQAKIKLDRAAEIIRGSSVSPTFSSSLDEARRDLLGKLKVDASARLKKTGDVIDRAASLNAPLAIEQLRAAKGEADAIAGALPDDRDAASMKHRVDELIKSTANRWLLAAQAAEKLAGCARALPMYEEIAARLHDLDPGTGNQAADGIARCMSFKR